jgi:ATP/ADP translocase
MILVIIIGFWSLANRLFTLLQGKRLYPVVSAGDVISISIGSFLLPFIVRLIGVENLFLIVMVSIIINIASVLIIQGKYRERLAETEPLQVSVPQQRQGNPLRSYYILLIFVLFVVGWTFNYALDYAFLGQLQSRYSSDPEQVAGFIGIMFGIIQLTNFVLKFFFSGRLVSRYGLRFGLFIGPIVITLGVLSSTIVGVSVGVVTAFFWLIAITKYIE